MTHLFVSCIKQSDGWLLTNCVLSMSAILSNEQTKVSHNATQISLLSTNTLIYSEFTNYDKGRHWNVTLELHLKNFVLTFIKEGISESGNIILNQF